MSTPARSHDFSGNPLESDSPETWERLIVALGPSSMLVCIQERMGPKVSSTVSVEDVWQETLLHVWRDRARCEWRGLRAFRHWVLAIAENRVRSIAARIESLRHGGDARAASIDDNRERVGAAPPPVASTTPSRIASLAEEANAMRAALGDLDPELVDVVRLRLFEDLPVEDVAQRLGIGISAVKHRFRKGATLYQGRLRTRLSIE